MLFSFPHPRADFHRRYRIANEEKANLWIAINFFLPTNLGPSGCMASEALAQSKPGSGSGASIS